jgi:hypothetical protein
MREAPWTNLVERGGTPFTKAHDPEGNLDVIDDAITAGAAATAAAAANTLKTAMLTNAIAGTGAVLTLAEPTGGGASVVTMTAPALAANRVITVPDADVTLANIAVNVTGISNIINGTTARTGLIKNTQNVGAVSAGVAAVEVGDGKHHVTTLTLTNKDLGAVAGAGNHAVGALIYTFPAGVHLHSVTYMSVGLTTAVACAADTPVVGIGSVIATGAQATLLAVGATCEDYIVGTGAANCTGTATVVGPVGAVAGIHTGISLSAAGGVKALHLNAADGWAGASATVLASGTVVLVWDTLA